MIVSCQKEKFTESTEIKNLEIFQKENSFSFDNERLVFDDVDQLEVFIKNLKTMDEQGLKDFFEYYYSVGFMPLHPYYDETDLASLELYLTTKKNYLPSNFKNLQMELDDPLISDDIFASLLNYKREIQIGGKIYAYTFSGLLMTDEKNVKDLENYIDTHNLYDVMPDPMTLNPGINQITNTIESYVYSKVLYQDPCDMQPLNYQGGISNPIHEDICSPNGGGSYNPPPAPVNHTANLISYIDNLEPCNYENSGIFGGWTPFGTRKVCYENFSGDDRRTKTLYSNENYYVYTAIQVKVKHQRHHSAFFASWWAAKETDEVALVIDQATFRITPGNMVAPTPNFTIPTYNQNKKIYYSGGLVINDIGYGTQIQSFPVPIDEYPSTPFDEDVIVQFYNDNVSQYQSMDITADYVRDIFWNQVYNRAKEIFNNQTGQDPTRITMIMPSQTSTIVHYVDLSYRQSNTRKIVQILDNDWAAEIKFSISLDGSGVAVTNPSSISDWQNSNSGIDINTGIEIGNLTTFDDIFMDFTGLSRNENAWKGSKMVYKAIRD